VVADKVKVMSLLAAAPAAERHPATNALTLARLAGRGGTAGTGLGRAAFNANIYISDNHHR